MRLRRNRLSFKGVETDMNVKMCESWGVDRFMCLGAVRLLLESVEYGGEPWSCWKFNKLYNLCVKLERISGCVDDDVESCTGSGELDGVNDLFRACVGAVICWSEKMCREYGTSRQIGRFVELRKRYRGRI